MISGTEALREAYRDERVAGNYVAERFREPLGALLHQRQVDAVKRVIAQFNPARVLEVAPGPARLTVDLAPFFRRPPVLIDASQQMLSEARRRLTAVSASAPLVAADAFQLPFAGVFDLVYSFRLIRHFERQDRTRLYAQIARILRPGGALVFDVVNEKVSRQLRDGAHTSEYEHYDALLGEAEVKAELAEAGFRVVSMVPVQHRYRLLRKIQMLVAPRSRPLARLAMEVLDRSGGAPLEWVVVCSRA